MRKISVVSAGEAVRGAGVLLVAAVLAFSPGSVSGHPQDNPGAQPPPAQQPPLDFVTGGGWIVTSTGAKANFGVGGGVKNGAFWGHLNYIDHGIGLHVQGLDVTNYIFVDAVTRDICGTARTNLFGDVFYRVTVTDNGEPGRDDIFGIELSNGYIEMGDLGGPDPGGGNIQLHKGNPSNTAPATPGSCGV